jgi:hypothetical protein
MKARLTLATCGRCGKSRGIRHKCVTRADSKRRKGRTSVKPKLTVTCGKCGKPRGLQHTCTIKTDFKKRRRQQARKKATAERRRRRAEAARKRAEAARARKAAAKTTRKRPRAAPHDPATCRDGDCDRYGCAKYREGFVDGHEDGYDEGFPDGIAACPKPHGGAR